MFQVYYIVSFRVYKYNNSIRRPCSNELTLWFCGVVVSLTALEQKVLDLNPSRNNSFIGFYLSLNARRAQRLNGFKAKVLQKQIITIILLLHITNHHSTATFLNQKLTSIKCLKVQIKVFQNFYILFQGILMKLSTVYNVIYGIFL